MVKSIRLSQKDNERHNGGALIHCWQTEIRATTWRMCYVAYTNRAVAVYNYTQQKGRGREGECCGLIERQIT